MLRLSILVAGLFFVNAAALAADLPFVKFPQSFSTREKDQPEWASAEAQAQLIPRLLSKHKGDMRRVLEDPEFLFGNSRWQFLNNFEVTLLERGHGQLPSVFRHFDLSNALNRPTKEEEEKARASASYGSPMDPYRVGTLSANYSFDLVLELMRQGEFMPVAAADVGGADGLRYWMQQYISDPSRRLSFYLNLMFKAAGPEDLAIFTGFYIDTARTAEERRDFATLWTESLSTTLGLVTQRYRLPLTWVWEEMFPALLANSETKVGWNSPTTYDQGFNVTLQSFLDVTQAEGVVPDLSRLSLNDDLENSIHVLSTYIVEPKGKDASAWQNSTKNFMQWRLPAGKSKEKLRESLKALLSIKDFEQFEAAWTELRKSYEGANVERSYAFGGVLWNVPFQLVLQEFLADYGTRQHLTPEQFFNLTAIQGNQRKQMEFYRSYIASLESIEDFMRTTVHLTQRLRADLSWAYLKDLEANPFFRQNAVALSQALWQKYSAFRGGEVAKTEWIVETFRQLAQRTNYDSESGAFFSLIATAAPTELGKAANLILADAELMQLYKSKNLDLSKKFASWFANAKIDCASRALN